MAIYGKSVAKAAPATNTCVIMVRPAASKRCTILELGVFNTTAVASSICVVRSLTSGTPSTSAVFESEDISGEASDTNLDSAWSAAPTITAGNRFRGIVLPATIGAGFVWTFPRGLRCEQGATTQVALWNFGGATAAALEAYAVIDE